MRNIWIALSLGCLAGCDGTRETSHTVPGPPPPFCSQCVVYCPADPYCGIDEKFPTCQECQDWLIEQENECRDCCYGDENCNIQCSIDAMDCEAFCAACP